MNTATAAELPFVIEEGTVYYESAYNFGSGRRGTVNKENVYTTIPCYAGINGYAYLDKRGNVLDSDYIENEDDIFIPESPKGAVKLFKHFRSTFHRNGWVDSDKIRKRRDKIPKVKKRTQEKRKVGKKALKPEKIVEDIGKDLQKKNQKTTIVIDFSGSMSAHQERVVDLLKTLEFNENTTIIVFGTNYEVISKKQLELEDFYVGGTTHMMKALNKATSLETEKLIIISDLCTYEDVPLKESETLKSVVIYDPDNGVNDKYIVKDMKDTWDQVEISRIRIK